MGQRTRRLGARWSRHARLTALTVLAASVAFTACGPSAASSRTDAIRIGRGPAGSSAGITGDAPTDSGASPAAIVSAWLAAESAFENAARTPDPSVPELAATTVAPQLPWSQSLLAQMAAAGEGAEGPVEYGHPQVVSRSATRAVVRSCLHDQEVVISLADGQPVAGPAGQVAYELFESTMVRTDSGWKLEAQTIGVGRCRGT